MYTYVHTGALHSRPRAPSQPDTNPSVQQALLQMPLPDTDPSPPKRQAPGPLKKTLLTACTHSSWPAQVCDAQIRAFLPPNPDVGLLPNPNILNTSVARPNAHP